MFLPSPYKLRPIYKGCDTADIQNYKPISVRPVGGVIYKRLNNFFHKYKVISQSQFDLQKHALVEVKGSPIEYLENMSYTLEFRLDFTEAFVRFQHGIPYT